MSIQNPFLGNAIPNKNNKLSCKNVHYSNGRYLVQKYYCGKRHHIRGFDNFDDARKCALEMSKYDLNVDSERNVFIQWVKSEYKLDNQQQKEGTNT